MEIQRIHTLQYSGYTQPRVTTIYLDTRRVGKVPGLGFLFRRVRVLDLGIIFLVRRRTLHARTSNTTLRLLAADAALDPLALAPGTLGTEAVYVPFDSVTLPE